MSLAIGITTEDGIVLAAESLGTLTGISVQQLNVKCKCGYEGPANLTCPKCNNGLGQMPGISNEIPTSHTHYCQKLFKINNHIGLTIVGNPKLHNIIIQQWLMKFRVFLQSNNKEDKDISVISKEFINFFNQMNSSSKNNGKTEIDMYGYDANLVPCHSKMVINSNKITETSSNGYGIVAAGVHEILDLMFGNGGIKNYQINDFPLQDAVEFAHFLMQTQIGVDKYSNRIPRVGGDIDIAVIHPDLGFKWIQQKDLQRILES